MKTAVHQYEDKLLEFAYGELPTPEAEAVEAHVRDCARCTRALSEIRAVRSTMSALPMEPAPDAGLESLLAYAEQAASRAKHPAPSRGWRRFLAPLASAMALVVVGVVAWRANQAFDPDPGLLAIQAEREASPTRKGYAPEEAPAPVAAAPAAPAEPMPDSLGDSEAGGRAAPEPELRKGKSKELSFAEAKRDEPARKAQAPLSTAKRSKLSEDGAKEEQQVALADDYSNAAQRGAYKPTPAPPPSGSAGVGFGLGAGGPLGGASSTAPTPSADKTIAGSSTRQEAPLPAPAQATPPPPPAKQSYELPGLSKKRPYSSAPAAEVEADELALERSDALKADSDAKAGERARAQSRVGLLEAARAAGSRGDRAEEARLAQQLLQGGATGYEKVEALKRACDALEAMGDFARADPYCDQLLSEFPQTAAAGAVAKRRSNVQRAMPASKPADVSTPAAAEPALPGR